MHIGSVITDKQATLSLNGRFDFNAHRDFRDAYEPIFVKTGINEIQINLSNVDYLDSSALGMLLLLKERAGENKIDVSITGCKGNVKQILDIANFGKLFKIS